MKITISKQSAIAILSAQYGGGFSLLQELNQQGVELMCKGYGSNSFPDNDECDSEISEQDLAEIWGGLEDDDLMSIQENDNYADFELWLPVQSDDTPDTEIAITWCVDDVLYQAKEIGENITPEQAKEILHLLDKNHDSTIGINWDVIDQTIINYLDKQAYQN